ncbi:Gfo/Idh/MocA family protein [Tunicatimonas pelagia]|uniref:Gfo/Idh/MocA family protein n=1 Tax=Tunicatimonas pelagia TaxID=931531 RepID=UPI002666CAD8|nr:Gfo/Idh/MocA family oxidoreductase [Tunicatimonas pelagia]WKN43867.1 Gfo/Idh/MocA family oxidoreductase [Tunicatimonas pelagia]
MNNLNRNRRDFIKKSALGAVGLSTAFSARSYGRILGANDRVRVGIVGFSNRCRGSLIPAFMNHADEMNFEIVGVSDIWNRRRDEAKAYMEEKGIKKVDLARNNEELYEKSKVDAVIISTADFQHALHGVEAIENGCDAYIEKPLAESMEDNKKIKETAEASDRIIQIGSQRRSGSNYHAAEDYIKSGKFGDIVMVNMTWNVNQPGRWRLPDLVASIKKEDTDWDRYLMNRPKIDWDPRKYLEYRLFWPYSSGIPGQWMSHQIDTVHWFSGYNHPRSVAANGGIYLWKDGRENPDTMTAVFDYGPDDNPNEGFQVVYSSRFTNSEGGTKEIYYSNAGTLNLKTNMITPDGGLNEKHASAMGMQPNRLEEQELQGDKVITSANTGADNMTSNHMRNWMDCVRSRKEPHAPVQVGYNHSVANLMTTQALHTGKRVTFNTEEQEIVSS